MKKIIVESKSYMRLDRYLRRYYTNITQGVIQKLLRNGQILVNNRRIQANMRVIENDIITINEDNTKPHQAIEYQSNVFAIKYQKLAKNTQLLLNIKSLADKLSSEYCILNHNNFIAINKPPSLAVQSGSKILISIDDALTYINHHANYNYTNGFKLIHRLDKDTSGILLIARGAENAEKLGAAFYENIIEKKYLAVVSGAPQKHTDTLITNIGKDRSGILEIVKELTTGGKIAKTYYEVLNTKSHYSLLQFTPHTGRMHQLRFHSQMLGCPIVGDKKYGGETFHRMLLHAMQIKIPSSVFDHEIIIKANTTNELIKMYDKL